MCLSYNKWIVRGSVPQEFFFASEHGNNNYHLTTDFSSPFAEESALEVEEELGLLLVSNAGADCRNMVRRVSENFRGIESVRSRSNARSGVCSGRRKLYGAASAGPGKQPRKDFEHRRFYNGVEDGNWRNVRWKPDC